MTCRLAGQRPLMAPTPIRGRRSSPAAGRGSGRSSR
jgi:hypothetical protein